MDYVEKIKEYYLSIWKKAARKSKDKYTFDAFRKDPNHFNIAFLVPYTNRTKERLMVRDVFMHFLEENGVLTEYRNHLGKIPGGFRVDDFVSDCNFLWSQTAHGRKFWEKLSDEWRLKERTAYRDVFLNNHITDGEDSFAAD